MRPFEPNSGETLVEQPIYSAEILKISTAIALKREIANFVYWEVVMEINKYLQFIHKEQLQEPVSANLFVRRV